MRNTAQKKKKTNVDAQARCFERASSISLLEFRLKIFCLVYSLLALLTLVDFITPLLANLITLDITLQNIVKCPDNTVT
jgi:hypothetical protein